MIVGVDTVHAKPGYEERFIRRVLETVRGLQTNTRFVVFTCEDSAEVYESWPRVIVGAPGRARLSGADDIDHVVRKSKVDMLLAPLAAASASPPAPQVLYALELSAWERDPETGKAPAARIKAAKKACAQARALFVPSEYLRRRCLELLEAPIDRTIVGPPGVDPVFSIVQKPLLDDPYVLLFYDAATAAFVPQVCEIFVRREKEFPHTLVVAGPMLEGEPIAWGPRIIRVDQCPDTILASLFRHAALCIYPAIHDGSAMRILEALRAGAIVATPHAGGATELAGDAPFYYNPDSSASMIQAVRWALELEGPQRKQRIHMGQGTAAKYAWEKTAWKLLSALKR